MLEGRRKTAALGGTGRRIDYEGQTEANFESPSCRVESFKVDVPVEEAQQLALRGNVTSMVRCSSGGDDTLIYTPPLLAGGSSRPAKSTDGRWIPTEAVIR